MRLGFAAAVLALAAVPTSANAFATFRFAGQGTGTIEYDSFCYIQDQSLCGKTLPFTEKFDYAVVLYDFTGIPVGSSYTFGVSLGYNAAAYNAWGTITRTGEASYAGTNYSSKQYEYDCCTRRASTNVFKVELLELIGGEDGSTNPGSGENEGGSHPEGAVPEPATWMTMILGFGLIGFALRRKTALRFV